MILIQIGTNLKFFIIQGTTFPALCTLLAQWAPPEEKGKLSTLVFAGKVYIYIYIIKMYS